MLWIPVQSALPIVRRTHYPAHVKRDDQSEPVLIWEHNPRRPPGGRVRLGYFSNGWGGFTTLLGSAIRNEVTHWMPPPPGPTIEWDPPVPAAPGPPRPPGVTLNAVDWFHEGWLFGLLRLNPRWLDGKVKDAYRNAWHKGYMVAFESRKDDPLLLRFNELLGRKIKTDIHDWPREEFESID